MLIDNCLIYSKLQITPYYVMKTFSECQFNVFLSYS